MQLRPFYRVLFLFLACIIVVPGIEKVYSEVDPYPSIEIPILSDGYKIKRVIGHPEGTKSLNYFVRIPYPATDVLQFYDSKLRQVGWVASVDKTKRHWERFIDNNGEGGARVRQLLASWINPALKLEAILVLRYVEVGNSWNNELHVLCQIQPFIGTRRLEDFFKRLSESKHHGDFMRLLDSYRMSNGDVDIDKAVRENPDNSNLQEYKRIINEITNRQKGKEKGTSEFNGVGPR